MPSQCLDDLGRAHLQLGTKNPVPEAAGNAKAVLVVSKVVLKMVLLQLLVPRRELLVVKEVVSQVVKRVAEHTTAVGCCRSIPVVEEDSVCELPEWCCKRCEQRRGHDQPIPVHWQVVVNTVEQEMQGESGTIVGKVAVKTLAMDIFAIV